ncbi:MAG: patatin-like phospholipase family protein [Steroidobacteraceae bacterium]
MVNSNLKVFVPAVCALLAIDAAIAAEPLQRPRIGLVLAGGGAKGGAHVGVLKVIEELRVPIDCIAGTSMGALIGAGYASGQPAAEIEKFVTGVDWSNVVGGVGRRRLEPVEQKRVSTEASTPIELGFHNGHIVTPGGLADSSAIDDLLRTYVARARMVPDFNKLPIPFRAVATDMISGDMVVLDHGDLATAMRASMAIPGAFSPVIGNGYILSDVGMVRNIPVDVARNTCAEVVIVVNLVEPPAKPEDLVQATQLLGRSMEVMLEANEKVQLQSLTERDIRIDVPMGDIGTADFERVPETVPLGETAARGVADRLAALSVPENEYTAWRQRITTAQQIEGRVANVRFEGLERVNPEYLRSLTTIKPGDVVDIDAISADARHMSALEEVESVAYRLEGSADEGTLVWLPKEPSIGATVLRPSLGMYADGGGDLKFLLGVQHLHRWLNGRGGQWRNYLQLGYESLITSSLYQPIDVAQRFFVEPGLFASRSAENLYADGNHVATYRFVDYGGRVETGWNLSRAAQLRAGYVASERRARVQTGLTALPEANFLDAGLTAGFRYDSRDAATFATRGIAAAIEYQKMDESLGSDRDWERIEAAFRTAVPIGKNLMWISLAGGADLGDNLPGDRAFSLGGPRTLPAFQHDELRVREYWLAQASFLWRLKELVPIKNQAIYGGFGVQAAGLYDRVDFLVEDDEVYGASAYLAGPTPLGTFTLGIGGTSGAWSVWIALGRPIGKGSILDDGLFR